MTTAEAQPTAIDTVLSEKTEALTVGEQTQGAVSNAASSATAEDLAPTGLVFEPLKHALPHCKPESQAQLTAEQQIKYEEMLATVKSWTEIPTTTQNTTTEPLNDTDKVWLTRDCLLRYLRATKWNLAEAGKRLLATLTWQREYGMRSVMTPEYMAPEMETGKIVLMGFDNSSRPCLYLNPGKQNTKLSERQNQALVYMLERVIDLMEPGQETNALVVNYKDTKSKSNPPISQGRAVLLILQNHYPERLGRAIISDLPWYVNAFFKLISPFIDPVTKSKMVFNEPLTNHVPPEELLSTYGGRLKFEWKYDVYWPALLELCDKRRSEYVLRWEKAGKQIGESEFYLRGGDAPSLNGEFNGSNVLSR